MRKHLTLLDARVGEVNRRDDFLDRIEGLLEWGLLVKALSRVEMRNEVGRRAIDPMILVWELPPQAPNVLRSGSCPEVLFFSTLRPLHP